MRIAIVAVLVVWAAAFAAVVASGGPPGSVAAPAADGSLTPRRSVSWVVLERVPRGWRQVRGPFAGAEVCLHASDRLNNRDAGHVFDCDEVRYRSAAARTRTPSRDAMPRHADHAGS